MKANEYFKKHGYRKCKSACAENGWLNTGFWIQLKRLVESHELVEKCGGLNSLKAWVKETKSKLSLATYFHCNKPPVLIQIENAEKAIADVESCMEVESDS